MSGNDKDSVQSALLAHEHYEHYSENYQTTCILNTSIYSLMQKSVVGVNIAYSTRYKIQIDFYQHLKYSVLIFDKSANFNLSELHNISKKKC